MRVIAGSARSLKLITPEGLDTRPTSDRIKETLFNMLQGEIPGSVIIDLFSGSGGIGIEALSRGAKHVYFVENNTAAFKCIQENVKFTKFENQSTLLKQDAVSTLTFIKEKEVDLIFMDPPYNKEFEIKVLIRLKELPYVTEDTLIILETSLDYDFTYLNELSYELVKQKRYKTNQHLFMKRRVEE